MVDLPSVDEVFHLNNDSEVTCTSDYFRTYVESVSGLLSGIENVGRFVSSYRFDIAKKIISLEIVDDLNGELSWVLSALSKGDHDIQIRIDNHDDDEVVGFSRIFSGLSIKRHRMKECLASDRNDSDWITHRLKLRFTEMETRIHK